MTSRCSRTWRFTGTFGAAAMVVFAGAVIVFSEDRSSASAIGAALGVLGIAVASLGGLLERWTIEGESALVRVHLIGRTRLTKDDVSKVRVHDPGSQYMIHRSAGIRRRFLLSAHRFENRREVVAALKGFCVANDIPWERRGEA